MPAVICCIPSSVFNFSEVRVLFIFLKMLTFFYITKLILAQVPQAGEGSVGR